MALQMCKIILYFIGVYALVMLDYSHSANAQKVMSSSFSTSKPLGLIPDAAFEQRDQIEKEIVKLISDAKMRLPASKFANVGGTFLVVLDINSGGKLEDYLVAPRAETNSTFTRENAEMISRLLRGFIVSPVLAKVGIRVWVELNLNGREWDRKIRHGEKVSSGNDKKFNHDPYNLAITMQSVLLTYLHYPARARESGIEGTVTISMDVVSLRDSKFKNVRLVSSPSPILSAAVINTLKKAYFVREDDRQYINSGHIVVDINFGAALR